jgi:adenylate cyclase
MKRWKNVIVGLSAAVFFSLVYIVGFLSPIEDRLYDFFLRFRPDRELSENIVLLDVDDIAIAYNGVFPWPRSVMADGLLRLKEYGADAAIFDIEYIDKGPQGVDSLYLNNGLPSDFSHSFSEINSAQAELFSALSASRLSSELINEYSGELSSLIVYEHDNLLEKAQSVARDNDLYLGEASALFGKSWGTLNLQLEPLSGEQAERRPMAEERFSLSIAASSAVYPNPNKDILPPISIFAESVKGAGFTNVEVDSDGVRRRIFLAQNVNDHWYAQLAFAPLLDYLGNPAIELTRNTIRLKNARLPSETKDISIPLDGEGKMMLNWPRKSYLESFKHLSFAEFSSLEDYEAEIERYARALSSADLAFFSEQDASLALVPFLAAEAAALYDEAQRSRSLALQHCSDEDFASYVNFRTLAQENIQEIINLNLISKANAVAEAFFNENSPYAEAVKEESDYIVSICNLLNDYVTAYNEIKCRIEEAVRGKFCILGRSDTGTTDIGVNPFFAKYVNVGTHAVLMDTILSESFINPLGIVWSILVALFFIPFFFFVTAFLSPVPRTILGFASAVFILAASILLFRFTGIFFGPLGTVLAITAAVVIREIISYAGSDREKRFYRKAFATYTSEAVAEEIAKNPSLLQLGGTKRYMSALFTDIKGFSTISEKLSPEELVSLLNRYLTVMSNVILDTEGTIDKYEGDAIIAFFGAPLEQADHAFRACDSAIKMKKAEAELNKIILEQKLSPVELLTRIGINSGDMVAGNMGTEKKMNYTIMGDSVNLAARLEGINKQYGTWILTSENTIQAAGENRFLVRRLDRVRVVGKSEAVQLYNVLDHIEIASTEQKKLVNVFHEALDYFEKRDWKKAQAGFAEAASQEQEGTARIYLQRCEQYLAKEPDRSWDGVFNLTEK